MSTDAWVVKDTANDNVRTFDSRSEAEDAVEDLEALGGCNPELIPPDDRETDGGPEAEVVDVAEPTERTDGPDPTVLAQDPIEWLENKNGSFVNVIQGTPAISKRGFRFIQQQFDITTKTEVVETFDDPLGVIVWAKAERPNGQSAEGHGEGYRFEDDVEDNEFVRYADTRAKNRAISDLTSAGALAVSELSETGDGADQ